MLARGLCTGEYMDLDGENRVWKEGRKDLAGMERRGEGGRGTRRTVGVVLERGGDANGPVRRLHASRAGLRVRVEGCVRCLILVWGTVVHAQRAQRAAGPRICAVRRARNTGTRAQERAYDPGGHHRRRHRSQSRYSICDFW